jgi:hypothetical protein
VLHKPQGLKIVDLCLACGLNWSWGVGGRNALLGAMFPPTTTGPFLHEQDALLLLRRFKRAGAEVGRFQRPASSAPSGDPGSSSLLHTAAWWGLAEVVEFAVTEAGCDVNAAAAIFGPNILGPQSPLSLAVMAKHSKVTTLLLSRFKAQPFNEGLATPFAQPLSQLYDAPKYSDAEVLELTKEFLRLDKDFFVKTKEFFSYTGDPAQDAGAFLPQALHWNPLISCMSSGRTKAVQFLLQTTFPGLLDFVDAATLVPFPGGTYFLATPAQWAAIHKDKQPLELLLKFASGKITLIKGTPAGRATIYGKDVAFSNLPSVKALTAGMPLPRSLAVALERAIKKEEELVAEEKKKKEKEAQEKAALEEGATTTGFIDPGMKAISAREAKEKERKKAAKKKAKAKKRAAAKQAAAGAGKPEEYVDSSDETDDGEEPGKEDLVDSRNAPDLTMMLAARKAAREKEEREKKDKA